MNLKPEDVMRALECCTFNPNCEECPLGGEDCIQLDQLALALLRELTEQNLALGGAILKKDAEIEKLKQVDGNATGIWDGIAYIIWGEKGKTVYITAMGDDSDRFFTLSDCLAEIGYNGEGGLIVILEDALSGKVYRYGNYADCEWYEVGTTMGYA